MALLPMGLAFVFGGLLADGARVEIRGAVRRMRLADRYVGATLDWWPNSKTSPNPGAEHPWTNASILHVDLSNPTLRAAVANLAPFILRVGGSLADQVVYEATCDGLGFVANASDYRGFGFSGGCVEYARVHELLDWCSELGCEVALGLNMLAGRTPAPGTTERWRGAWDATNALALLADVRARPDGGRGLRALELGNEVDGAAGIAAKLPANATMAAFGALRRGLDALWRGGADRPPAVFGPDSSGFDGVRWMPELLADDDGALDAVTYHLYSLGSGSSAAVPEEVVNATYLNELAARARRNAAVVAERAPGLPLILGEGGGCWNSGQHGTTDAYRSGFWYLDWLGTLAYNGRAGLFNFTST